VPRKASQLKLADEKWVYDLFTEAAVKILRRHKAPEQWHDSVCLLVQAADGGFIGPRVPRPLPSDRTLRKLEEQVLSMRDAISVDEWGVLSLMSRQDPGKFFRVMYDLRCEVEKRQRSPRQAVAMEMAARPELASLPQEDVAAAMQKHYLKGLPVTAKVVEKAKALARGTGVLVPEGKPKGFPPKKAKLRG
jgi:hypothetical protein